MPHRAPLPKSDAWTAVIQERRHLIDDLHTLAPDQWSSPTACAGWDVHDVVAHLVDTARTTRRGFIRDMAAARMDFDRANARGVARARRATPARTLADLERHVARTTGPPAHAATRLVEAYVHGEDVRRAVGLHGADRYPPALVAAALRYQTTTSTAFGGGRERIEGLALIADDTDFAIGEGAEVRGSALALLLAVSGRTVADDELHGPGAAALRDGSGTWPSERLWDAIHAERAALVDDLADLDQGSWHTPSLCQKWTVEEVVAHLSAAASTGRFAWLRSVLGARFDFDLHNRRRLAEHRGPTPADTLAGLRAVTTSTSAASGHTAAWLGEVVVHAQDVRHPLGITTAPDPDAVVQVARFFASRDFAVASRTTSAGLRLEADDTAFAAGPPDGARVRGPVLALTMVMAGRAAYLDQLEGDGTGTLRARLSRGSGGGA